MTEEESESRSDRLRRRRSQRTSEPNKTDETDVTDNPSKPSKPSEPNVKEAQVGTYMYLPEPQKKEFQRLYNVLKAEYEYEFDEEFEKNRHFYPLLIQFGLEGLQGLDASDLKKRLDEI
jgi:hypothetical protein